MNPYKQAVLTICTPVEPLPLAEPPMPETDVGVAIICPQCGSGDPVVQMVNDASVAKCHECQYEFTPPAFESQAKRVVKILNERRRRWHRAKAMPPHERRAVEHEAFRLLGV
jgi:ribosomal protein L37AE/L43A